MVRRKRTSPETLLSVEVPLPGLAEQRRVYERLDAAMGSLARVGQLKRKSDALVRQHADSLFRSVVA
jgi:type I restriction enzyme, S subunit